MPEVFTRLGLGAAASAALYGLALWFAPAATLLAVLVPLPGLVVATRGPSIECSLWFLLSVIAITLGFGVEATPGFALLFGVPTLVVAVGIRRFWSFEHTALAGVATWTGGIAALLFLAYGDVGSVVAAVHQQLTRSVDLALSTYGSIGAPQSTLALMQAERDQVIAGLLETSPALVVLTGTVIILTNLLLLRRWADFGRHANLRLWRTPDALIWALIVAGFGLFAPVPAVAVVAQNVFIIILAGYFCQGLAIVSYYLDRFRLPRGLRIAGYVLIAVQHLVTVLVLALGVFDLWGNFRRLSTGSADMQFHADGD